MSRRPRTRRLVAAFATVAATALATVTPATAADNPIAQPRPAPTITWVPCPASVTIPGTTCGQIPVPVDYHDPAAGTMTVGFIRRPATGTSHGTVFMNPGGPGGSAYVMVGATYTDTDAGFTMPQSLTRNFDLVGVQPRGLKGSSPLNCGPQPAAGKNTDKATGKDTGTAHDGLQDHPHAPQGLAPVPGAPEGPIAFDPLVLAQTIVTPGAGITRLCEMSDPRTRHITTENTARDFNEVRRALGVDTISLVGLSYGTYLMSVFATLFPEHTDKVVLDSGFDPAMAWSQLIGAQQSGYLSRFYAMLGWIARHDDVYHLGKTPHQVYDRWARAITQESGIPPAVTPPPLTDQDTQVGDETTRAIINATEPAIIQGRVLAARAAHPGPPTSQVVTAATLQSVPAMRLWPRFAAALAGLTTMPSQEDTLRQVRSMSEADRDSLIDAVGAFITQKNTLICNEDNAPAQWWLMPQSLWSHFITTDAFTDPYEAAASGRHCLGVAPVAPVFPISGAALATRPLQLQGRFDPQTPYAYFGPMATAMGSHVVTIDDGSHGHFALGNPDVDRIVTTYLLTGTATATTAAPFVPQPATHFDDHFDLHQHD